MLMNDLVLTKAQFLGLRVAHKQAKNKRDADRIKVIYSLAIGHSFSQVASILMLDEDTVRRYQNLYLKGGIPELLKNHHQGGHCRMSDEELECLIAELEENIHLTTQSVIEFVKAEFDIEYTQSGMRDLLHRLGYEYKKPKLVPGNPDEEAQAVFAEQYEAFMLSKSENTEVLFVDAVHPEHNTLAAYGWIKRGQIRKLQTNSGRARLNLHGAINAETYQVTIIESETVNTDSTINLFCAIEQTYPAANGIILILDNAKYHYSRVVRDYLKQSRIKLAFLPSYSPNLNLIERLWKFFKKNVLYNKYYATLDKFRQASIHFFRHINQHHEHIARFMSAPFDLS